MIVLIPIHRPGAVASQRQRLFHGGDAVFLSIFYANKRGTRRGSGWVRLDSSCDCIKLSPKGDAAFQILSFVAENERAVIL